jgi:hypothetical protein
MVGKVMTRLAQAARAGPSGPRDDPGGERTRVCDDAARAWHCGRGIAYAMSMTQASPR